MVEKPLYLGFVVFGLICLLTGAGSVSAETAEEKEARLKAELQKVEQEIAGQRVLLQSQQKETASIKRDVDVLTSKINTAQLNIKAKNLTIDRLGGDIVNTVKTIETLESKLTKEQRSLVELLRRTREFDDQAFAEIILAEESLTDLFVDLERFRFIEQSIHNVLAKVRVTKAETEKTKTQLEIKRSSEADAKKVIEEEKLRVERLNNERKIYLNMSQAEENAYRKIIAAKERERAAIRDALFRLQGATNITFGQALDHANFVASKIKIRPAFLLAIITQESNLGQNIGTCNRPGDPESKSWQNIMKPSRDIKPYLSITKSLGLDPATMPLSCPYMGGYGGAMGPSQFIPSTWIIFISRVVAVTGDNPPSPWNPRDAFVASGLYPNDLGAGAMTYTAERNAACRYYSGAACAPGRKPANVFYGDQVMAIATKYQQQIEILQN